MYLPMSPTLSSRFSSISQVSAISKWEVVAKYVALRSIAAREFQIIAPLIFNNSILQQTCGKVYIVAQPIQLLL
jgi:hypothetical protein